MKITNFCSHPEVAKARPVELDSHKGLDSLYRTEERTTANLYFPNHGRSYSPARLSLIVTVASGIPLGDVEIPEGAALLAFIRAASEYVEENFESTQFQITSFAKRPKQAKRRSVVSRPVRSGSVIELESDELSAWLYLGDEEGLELLKYLIGGFTLGRLHEDAPQVHELMLELYSILTENDDS